MEVGSAPAETSRVCVSHPERKSKAINNRGQARCMRMIVQQSGSSANLIKLRKHVHPDYSFDIGADRLVASGAALYVGGLSLLMADCNQWRVVCMAECVCLAIAAADRNPFAGVAARCALSSIAFFCSGFNCLGICIEFGIVVSRGDSHRDDTR